MKRGRTRGRPSSSALLRLQPIHPVAIPSSVKLRVLTWNRNFVLYRADSFRVSDQFSTSRWEVRKGAYRDAVGLGELVLAHQSLPAGTSRKLQFGDVVPFTESRS